MRTINFFGEVKALKNLLYVLSFTIIGMYSVTSCSESMDGNSYVTFEEDQVISFLEKDGRYTEYLKWLSVSGIRDLLSAYGTYTVFAPTDDAILKYYAEKETSFEQLPLEDLTELTFNHILPIILPSLDFPQGIVGTANMSDKFLNITYTTQDSVRVIIINDRARVVALDQEVHNGIIHTVNEVILSSKIQLPDVILADERLSLFTEALFETKLSDSLRTMDDKEYQTGKEVSKKRSESKYMIYPPFRKRGHTVLVESDSVFALHGITNMNELKAYAAKIYDVVYPEDKNISDITNRRNSLNRFVAYHCSWQIQASNEYLTAELEYFYTKGTPIHQYVEMMCPNTLMEITDGKYFNKRKDGSSIQIISGNHEAMNGLYHEIDGILAYDEGVENDVLNKRIRIEFASMFPEMMTNKLRTKYNGDADRWIIPDGYLTNLTFTDNTQMQYFGCQCWHNFEGDEILLAGRYDFTVRTPPIPAGTYEVRFGYSPYAERGIGQMYFDGMPCGIPLNNSLYGDNVRIGWQLDANTEDNGVENDKMMRNRGYMKGPVTMLVQNQGYNGRTDSWCLRRVLTTTTFDKAGPHTFRVKCVEEKDREFQLDYMEFVPTYVLENEGRD
jgi:uncharacterized surface protein with fasciclin (FAS1) repeats